MDLIPVKKFSQSVEEEFFQPTVCIIGNRSAQDFDRW